MPFPGVIFVPFFFVIVILVKQAYDFIRKIFGQAQHFWVRAAANL
jgi:hypothetical protein